MATRQFFNSWISYLAEIIYLGANPPDPTKFYAILSTSNAINRTMQITDVVTLELSAINGYSRQQLIFEPGTYDSANQRYESLETTIDISANSDGNIQFQSIIILADAISSVGDITGKMVAFYVENSPIKVVAGQTQSFIIPVYVSGI
jgi:hypothetical protein